MYSNSLSGECKTDVFASLLNTS